MTKIAKSMFVIVIVAFIAIGATTATWNDSDVVDNNSFSTGTLSLSTNPTTALFTVTNMYPGYFEEQSIVITNDGTVPLNYDIAALMASGSAALYGSAQFELRIGTASGLSDVYNGTVSGLAGLASIRPLAASTNETLYFTVELDSAAGNGLEGLTTVVDFTFSSSQP